MWEARYKCKGIINIIDGFHTLLVNLKIIYKKYGLKSGLERWWVKSKITADGSVDKALEGWYYSKGTRLQKNFFWSSCPFKCKSLEKDFQLNFFSKVKKLREITIHENLLDPCNDEKFKQIKQQILANSWKMAKSVTEYVRNVRKVLSRIAAYQDQNIELKLQAQREFLPLLFAFNNQNYSRYLTYHHFELQALKSKNF